MLDPAAVRVWPAVAERGALGDLYDLGLAVASRLSVQLGAPPVPDALRLERPPLDALQAYVQGLGTIGYDERVRLLEMAIARFPTFDRARLALADAHAEVGDHDRALAAARGVPSSSTRARAARFRVARALIELDQHEAAFGLLQELVAEQPAAALFNNLGLIQIRRGSMPEVMLTPILMILGITYSWRYWRNKGRGRIILVALLYGGAALLWLFVVPLVTESSIWTGNRVNHPELAYAVLASAVLGFGWSVIYTVMSLKVRRSK